MISLREQVDQGHFLNAITGGHKTRQIAGQRGRVARYQCYSLWLQFAQPLHDALPESGAWWIEQNQVGHAVEILQIRFGGILMRSNSPAPRTPGIEFEIAHCCRPGFHRDNLTELSGERERERSNARVKIQRSLALAALDRSRYQAIHQETVHLEKRVATHAKAPGVIERSRDQSRNSLRTPIEEAAGHRLRGVHHVQLHLLFVGKDLDRLHEARPAPIAQHFVQGPDRLIQFR